MTSVLLDATCLGEAAGGRGVGAAVRGLLGALAGRDDLDLRALVQDPTHPPAGITPLVARRRAPGRWRHLERDVRGSVDRARHAAGAVVHGLDTEPPLRSPAPTVQTLYDVIPLLVDDPHLAAARRRWLRLAHRFRAADRVVAISRHAAETGMQQLGLDHRRVVVAPLGVNAGWSPEGPVHTEPDGVPYVLLVGEYARRKGFAEAFAVVADLARRGLPHRLVVAGRLVPWTEPTVRSLVAGSGDASRIRLAGRVDDLGALYRGADAVVVTARAEGFGLPPVEAMACGTPVVSFANTALTETVGDGGVLVPDGDVAAFAAALADVLGDDAARRDLVAAGAARVRSLTWAACADVHVAVYRELGG